ncbi:AMP-binding protein [Paraburkholderia kururiensis]|uniref:AMP-binding protein n=1 Tax=Paraburkholderia kururiensis TaxID=984307 RepID=UPI00035D8F4A|nr:AMP-binding protein [Paraburkholderia kururiensis]
MSSLPLVSHTSPDQTIAWRDGAPCSVRTFLADVQRLAAVLPAGRHVFNQCTDRYRFAVGLCAAMVAGRISVLPPSHTPAAVRELLAFAPDTFCLHDSDDCAVDLPQFRFPEPPSSDDATANPTFSVPQIDASQTVAYLFTSGSTGTPVPHGKRWGALVACLRASAARLGLLDGPPCTLVGTVPAQHMYGFETTVLLALVNGLAFSHARPFYPADIARELAAVPAPRVLVTSPVHLRALTLAGHALPPVALALSATAPLAPELARAAQAAFDMPLVEIYGSTETGQIATRRTAHEASWHLLPGVQLRARETNAANTATAATATTAANEDGTVFEAHGAHVEPPVAMGDALEPLDDTRFLLHGRKADLINIAGKRTSLAYLNHQLNAIAGVTDGVFVMPDESRPALAPAGTPNALNPHLATRLMAFVVAPGLAAADLQRALRERIDTAFMPRPLVFVEALPRDANGKLTQAMLKALLDEHARALARMKQDARAHVQTRPDQQTKHEPAAPLTFTIPVDHPALPGHFPGRPIVPGVVLLERALTAIGAALNRPLDTYRLSSAKFPSSASPDEPLDVRYDITASGAVRFTVSASGRVVASGALAASAPTPQLRQEGS